jgi:hypothetical protein
VLYAYDESRLTADQLSLAIVGDKLTVGSEAKMKVAILKLMTHRPTAAGWTSWRIDEKRRRIVVFVEIVLADCGVGLTPCQRRLLKQLVNVVGHPCGTVDYFF